MKKTHPAFRPKILLGVTGSAAAYKAESLIRLLKPRFDVRVAMTRAACRLVRPSELQRASGSPVGLNAFRGVKPVPVTTPAGSHPVFSVPHIEFARECDLLLIAPATADFLAKMALGLADDLLSSCCLYASCPILVAPAMNPAMWANPAVQHNVRTLRDRGVGLLGPAAGHVACGDKGTGRMLEPGDIVREVERTFRVRGQWKGLNVLVTAGPTQEPLDPVRVLTNHSSGRMGYALAEAARDRGAHVTLVTGPVSLPRPTRVKVVPIRTAVELQREVLRALPRTDLAILAAAVSDYRPVRMRRSKMKKKGGPLTLRLRENPDVLEGVLRGRRPRQKVVGFAAETGDLLRRAADKWRRKPCDMLVANLVGEPEPDPQGRGFHGETNEVLVFCRGGQVPLHLARDLKTRLAVTLLDLMEKLWHLSTAETRSARRSSR